MIASGLMPRSPVWLRKIPSTVSGSQGSRRGFMPAVRFAFPLGARLNITLRARPCQELFSESFSGRPAGRGAPRLPGFCPSRRRVRYYTRPRRPGGGKPARTQDADNSSAAERGRMGGVPIVLSTDLLANFARWGQRCRGPRKGPAPSFFDRLARPSTGPCPA